MAQKPLQTQSKVPNSQADVLEANDQFRFEVARNKNSGASGVSDYSALCQDLSTRVEALKKRKLEIEASGSQDARLEESFRNEMQALKAKIDAARSIASPPTYQDDSQSLLPLQLENNALKGALYEVQQAMREQLTRFQEELRSKDLEIARLDQIEISLAGKLNTFQVEHRQTSASLSATSSKLNVTYDELEKKKRELELQKTSLIEVERKLNDLTKKHESTLAARDVDASIILKLKSEAKNADERLKKENETSKQQVTDLSIELKKAKDEKESLAQELQSVDQQRLSLLQNLSGANQTIADLKKANTTLDEGFKTAAISFQDKHAKLTKNFDLVNLALTELKQTNSTIEEKLKNAELSLEAHMTSAAEKIELAGKQNDSLEKVLKSANEKNISLQSELEQAIDERANISNTCKEAQETVDALQIKNSSLEKKLSHFVLEVETGKKRSSELLADLTSSRAATESLAYDLKNSLEQNAKLSESLEFANHTILELKQTSSTLDEKLKTAELSLEKQMAQATADAERAEKQIEALENSLKSYAERQSRANQEIDAAKLKVSELISDLASKKEVTESLTQDLRCSQQQYSKLADSYDRANLIISELQNKNLTLEQDLASASLAFKEQLDRANSTITETNKKVEVLKSELSSVNRTLEEKTSQYSQELETAQKHISDLLADLASSRLATDSVTQDLNLSREEHYKLTESFELANRAITALKQTNSTLEEKLKTAELTLEEQIAKAAADIDQSDKQIEALEIMLKSTNEQNLSLQLELQQLRDEHSGLKQSFEELNLTNADLRNEKSSIEQEFRVSTLVLNGQIAHANSEIETTKNQVSGLLADLIASKEHNEYLAENLKRTRDERVSLSQCFEEAQCALAELNCANANLELQLKALTLALEEQSAHANHARESAEKQQSELRSDLDDTQIERDSLSRQLELSQDERARLESDLHKSSLRETDLAKQTQDLEMKLKTSEYHYAEQISSERRDYDEQLSALKDRFDSASLELMQIGAENTQLRDRIQALESAANVGAFERESLSATIQEKDQRLTEVKLLNSKLEKDIETAERTFRERIKDVYSTHEAETEAGRKSLKEAVNEIEKLSAVTHKLREQSSSSKAEILRLNEERVNRKQELDAAQSRLQELEGAISDSKSIAENMVKELQAAVAKIAELEADAQIMKATQTLDANLQQGNGGRRKTNDEIIRLRNEAARQIAEKQVTLENNSRLQTQISEFKIQVQRAEQNAHKAQLRLDQVEAQNQEFEKWRQLLETRENQLRHYANAISREKSQALQFSKQIAEELRSANSTHPLKDYLKLTEFELSKLEFHLKKTPMISPGRASLENSLAQLIEQREFLKGVLGTTQRQLENRAEEFLKLVESGRLAPIPPPPPRPSLLNSQEVQEVIDAPADDVKWETLAAQIE